MEGVEVKEKEGWVQMNKEMHCLFIIVLDLSTYYSTEE